MTSQACRVRGNEIQWWVPPRSHDTQTNITVTRLLSWGNNLTPDTGTAAICQLEGGSLIVATHDQRRQEEAGGGRRRQEEAGGGRREVNIPAGGAPTRLTSRGYV